MEATLKTVVAVQEITAVPSRSLYRIAMASRHLSGTIVQQRHVTSAVTIRDTAVQRVLRDEAVLLEVVEWVAANDTQHTTEWHSYSPSTQRQLLAVALTCRAWFHPGLSWLWRYLDDLNVLARLLLPESLREEDTPEEAQFKYAKEMYYVNPVVGSLHPQFLIFRYYAGMIHSLCMTGMDFSTAMFSKLACLHDADVLFPSLRSVSWLDGMADITPRAIRTFGLICRAPLLTTLAIGIYDPDQKAIHKRLRTLQNLSGLLDRVANYASRLKALTVVGPSGVTMSVLGLLRFRMLDHVNIQVSIHVPTPALVPSVAAWNLDADDRRPLLRTLSLTWVVGSSILSILLVYRLSNLTSLTLTADDHPPDTFLQQVRLFGEHVPPCLKFLRIEAGIQVPMMQKGMDFETFIQPFLRCSDLEEVSIILPSFCIQFYAADFQRMLAAWPNVRSLNVSFFTAPSNRLPDLRSVIHESLRCCPNLTTLHLPAIATYKHIDPLFSLRLAPVSSPYQLHFSSNILIIDHHPLDIAYWISKAFMFNPIRSDCYIIGGSWSSIRELVQAIKSKDTVRVVKSPMPSWWVHQCGYTEA
ncbi:hypothetical protein GSI_08767 [Ganoderma sinense ZZ0214-1]|uniref:F-box domain-containing protein n=1 Tax=Ganoderma sinense ZZ0214-1 TaxID=1077348 RepID=A0A2G8S4M2_9APHY|nr:hypothetical protein GSI_08767 [Ganoderma sinense ZZ0214-1]